LPIVESRESKTRSKEGILPSFRISKHKSVRRQNIFSRFSLAGKETRYLHVSSSFRPFPRALSICFHVICPVLRARAVSSVHTPRCSHQCSPHPLPWLRISLRSRPQSSRRASCADPKRRAGAGEAPSSRRRAPAGHLHTDGNEHVSSRERAHQWIRALRSSLTATVDFTSGQAARPRERVFPIHSCRPTGPFAMAMSATLWQHAAHWR
jgi:hypothetical protein